jgi:hypothetical protein
MLKYQPYEKDGKILFFNTHYRPIRLIAVKVIKFLLFLFLMQGRFDSILLEL